MPNPYDMSSVTTYNGPTVEQRNTAPMFDGGSLNVDDILAKVARMKRSAAIQQKMLNPKTANEINAEKLQFETAQETLRQLKKENAYRNAPLPMDFITSPNAAGRWMLPDWKRFNPYQREKFGVAGSTFSGNINTPSRASLSETVEKQEDNSPAAQQLQWLRNMYSQSPAQYEKIAGKLQGGRN